MIPKIFSTNVYRGKSGTSKSMPYIPNMDDIYTYIDEDSVDKESHPYGVILADDTLDAERYYHHLFGAAPHRRCLKEHVIELLFFVVVDKLNNPIPVDKVNKKRNFTNRVKRFSDMIHDFRISTGVFQPSYYRRYISRDARNIFNRYYKQELNTHNYKFGFMGHKVKFLDVTDMHSLYSNLENGVNDYLEKYAFVLEEDNNAFMFDPEMCIMLEEHDAHVEPISIVDDTCDIPVLSSYVILFSDREQYFGFLMDSIEDKTIHNRMISISSSGSMDSFSTFYNNICSLLDENNIDCAVIARETGINDTVDPSPIVIHMNDLYDNSEFVSKFIHNGMLQPVELRTNINGYSYSTFQSTEMYYARLEFFSLLKLKSKKDKNRIRKITINKYLMDITEDGGNYTNICYSNITSIIRGVYFNDD